MDASALRWTLAIIGIVLLVGIYLYGLQQNRMRKRAARDTFTREEIDSAFIEDQELREELDNIGEIISTDSDKVNLNEIKINPALEADLTPVNPEPVALYIAEAISEIEADKLVSHLLMYSDYRLLTGEEIQSVVSFTGIEMNPAGLLEYYEAGQHSFTIANLSEPGHFSDLASAEFTTIGLNCFINLETAENSFKSYETMLKKIDEIVRLLNFKVYHSNQQILTISDVTDIRKNLSS